VHRQSAKSGGQSDSNREQPAKPIQRVSPPSLKSARQVRSEP
jgi:hypothetical protein